MTREPYPRGAPFEFNGVMMQVDRPIGDRRLYGFTMADLEELQKNSLQSSTNTEADVGFRKKIRDEMLRRENRIDRVIELLEHINEKLMK